MKMPHWGGRRQQSGALFADATHISGIPESIVITMHGRTLNTAVSPEELGRGESRPVTSGGMTTRTPAPSTNGFAQATAHTHTRIYLHTTYYNLR